MMHVSALSVMERHDVKDRHYRYEYLMARERFRGRNAAIRQH